MSSQDYQAGLIFKEQEVSRTTQPYFNSSFEPKISGATTNLQRLAAQELEKNQH
jgi:hypothetical protein